MQGKCQCGSVTYEVNDPIAVVFCCCTECHKLSAGVGSYSMFVPVGNFKLLTGETATFERPSESGATNTAHFCPGCGNRIYSLSTDTPGICRIKAGTLDDARSLKPDVIVWTRSAPDWLEFPEGALVYETAPTMEQGLKDLHERRRSAGSR
jgi:hypothetical protein